MNATAKALTDPPDGIFLVKGNSPLGKKIFAYIKISKAKVAQLEKDIAEKVQIDFTTYGEVLASGDGEPSEPIRRFMETHHNFSHDDDTDKTDV